MKERQSEGRQNKEEKWRMEGKKGRREGGVIGVFNLSVFQLSFSIQSPTPHPWDQRLKPNLWGGWHLLLSCPLNVPMSRNPPFNLFQQILKIHTETFTCPIKCPDSYQLAVLRTPRPWIPIWVQTAKRQKDRGWGMSNMKTKRRSSGKAIVLILQLWWASWR